MKKLLTILLLAPLFVFGQTQIKTNQINPTLPSNFTIQNNGHSFGADSLLLGNPPKSTGITTQNAFMGDSYSGGTGATDTLHGYVSLVSKALNMGIIHGGSAGGKVVDHFNDVPHKTSNTYKLFIQFGINDAGTPGYTNTQFAIDYKRLLDSTISRGWSYSQLCLVNISGTAPIDFPSNIVKYVAFNKVIDSLATLHGCSYADIYTALQDPKYGGYTYINADGLHVNNFGHVAIAWTILQALPMTNSPASQVGIFKGEVDISHIMLKDFNTSQTIYPLGVDMGGALHPIIAFSPQTRTNGNFVIGGSLFWKNAYTPPAPYDTLKDMVQIASTKIFSGLGPTNYAWFELFNGGSGATSFHSLFSNTAYNWYYSNSDLQALGINSSGQLQPYQGIYFPNTTAGIISATAGGGIGTYKPFTGAGNSEFTNTFNSGQFTWFNSLGSLGSSTKTMVLDSAGNFTLQHAGTFTHDKSAIAQLNSTTQGFLPPRMTTTQQNAISTPAEGLFIYDNVLHKPAYYNGSSWSGFGTGTVTSVASGYGMNFSTITSSGSAIVDSTVLVYTANPRLKSSSTLNYVWTATDAVGHGSWQAASSGFANPMTTTGDIIYASSGSTPSRLGIGSTNQVLSVVGGVPTWATISGTGTVTSVATGNGLTGGTITSTGTLKLDTAIAQTILNFKPLGNTYWAQKAAANTFTANQSITLNQNAATKLTITNTNSTVNSEANVTLTSQSTSAIIGQYSPTTGAYGALVANNSYLYASNSVGWTLMADNATGTIRFATGGNSLSAVINADGSFTSGVAGSKKGTYKLTGNTSGTISIVPQAAAGTYEFDMPTTAGTANQVLTSQGGAGTAMTWTSPLAKPHNISTPTTGGTVNLTNNQYNIINPAGTLVALTVNLPSSPANNDCVFIKYTQNITTVTYSNGTVVDGITAPTAGGLVVLTYDSGTTSWY